VLKLKDLEREWWAQHAQHCALVQKLKDLERECKRIEEAARASSSDRASKRKRFAQQRAPLLKDRKRIGEAAGVSDRHLHNDFDRKCWPQVRAFLLEELHPNGSPSANGGN